MSRDRITRLQPTHLAPQAVDMNQQDDIRGEVADAHRRRMRSSNSINDITMSPELSIDRGVICQMDPRLREDDEEQKHAANVILIDRESLDRP